ncbi:LysR substrate-binding domain-containing protein [Pigmentiphaga sp. GD03639]|uniref:LysR substrate-binding domain-containing protein n=1 Tax=Pigmentiphaga daeguensis TaxID=414049 RepID=A0ABN1BCG9_9BURK|nr:MULTISPECIES: LysR substrate-binding domain-containing protein [unclassified Pigmentiphaga]MDH2238903.1 LysR substrate-binding domain-containing protein [Pigmentiphaga sp. GD03639]OVZ58681.1 transcriptional regulator LrhA [Pigmentiphaga sp. NML030171]
MKNFDLTQLRTLVAIAEHETYLAAAEKTHRTQAALTQQMQRLEAQAGVPLFEKAGRYKRLTAHGRRLLDYAKHMIAINDEAWRALKDRELTGSLRVGSPQDVADSILPPLLANIARLSPRLQMEIHVGRSPFLMESLRMGELDLTVSTREDPALEGMVLRTSPTVWLCSADYVFEPGKPVPLIIADEHSLYRRIALTALDAARMSWRTAYLAPHMIGIKAAIRAGLGVTARSVELLGPDMRVLGEKDGLPRLPDVSYYLWMRPDSLNPVLRQVYDGLKSTLRPLDLRGGSAA